jgi:hypothetical protein
VSENADQVAMEFREMLAHAAGTHTAVLGGLAMFGQRLLEHVSGAPENPEAQLLVGQGDPNNPTTEAYATWTVRDLPERLSDGGSVAAAASQQWIVYVFTQWEHEYRPRLAAALGISKDEVVVPLMGDIRLLRNDVVHHRGIATSDNTGKCEELDWFQPGDTIYVSDVRLTDFMTRLGLTGPTTVRDEKG